MGIAALIATGMTTEEIPRFAAYAASKAALNQALRVSQDDIHVFGCCVEPVSIWLWN